MAENEDGQDKSESPTARRRQQALDEGQVPRSAELSAAAVLLAGAMAIGMAGGPALGDFSMRVMRESAGALSSGALTPAGAIGILRSISLGLMAAMAPFVGGVALVTIAVNLAQSRGALTPGAISPKWHQLSPASGLKKMFSPEFRNRLDAVVQFQALGFDHILRVVDKFLIELEALLHEKNVSLSATPAARDWLAEHGFDPLMGARPMSRVIQDKVKRPLADELLFGKLMGGGRVAIDVRDDELVVEAQAEQEKLLPATVE